MSGDGCGEVVGSWVGWLGDWGGEVVGREMFGAVGSASVVQWWGSWRIAKLGLFLGSCLLGLETMNARRCYFML